jgi:hypothetical protein
MKAQMMGLAPAASALVASAGYANGSAQNLGGDGARRGAAGSGAGG